ncbi:MAG: efflux RND transporter periplasmic adaptor subunit [Thauera sp.]|nr:efflux RND transporter periplasmic adaptor subunit [Thauera sp.]
MKPLPLARRTLVLAAVLLPLLLLFIYAALRSGPLAPVSVTVVAVESHPITPALFGIGTVEARYAYRIGPTIAGRVRRLEVQVGDAVTAGQVLGEMDPVDLDDRARAQDALLRRTEAALAEARARQAYASAQAQRYDSLRGVRATSEEMVITKRQELQIADAALAGVRQDMARARADREALAAQRGNLRLMAPVDGVVTLRDAEPGSTVIAGQAVVELIDPASLWVNTRFDQTSAAGLAAALPAQAVLRSRSGQALAGRVLRVEPKADAITEETLAKIVFERQPNPLPPLGELAEVTVSLPALPEAPIIPNAAVRREGDRIGVWRLSGDSLAFVPVKLGVADLDGRVQVREGLSAGDRIVLYSDKPLGVRSKVRIVDHIEGVAP